MWNLNDFWICSTSCTICNLKKINYFTGIDTAPAPELLKTIQEAKNPVNFYNLANQAMEIMYNKTVEVLTVFKNGADI